MGRRERCSEDVARGRANQRRLAGVRAEEEAGRRSKVAENLEDAVCRGDRAHRGFEKAAHSGDCMSVTALRAIPSVDKVLLALGGGDLPRAASVAVVRAELAALRKQKAIPDFGAVLACVRSAIDALIASRLRPLLNGTG